MGDRTVFRTAATTNEQVVSAFRCKLHAVIPDLTTTGTVTLRNQGTAAGGTGNNKQVSAVGLARPGLEYHGAVFEKGLTIQLSAGTDLCAVVVEKY